MESYKERDWKYARTNRAKSLDMSRALNINEKIAGVLINRGIDNADKK